MHMQGLPRNMQMDPQYKDVIADIGDFLRATVERVLSLGISRERIVIDPGIGFGKTVEHNLDILNRIGELHDIGCPLLVGASRKSFLGKVLDRSDPLEREYGTAATTAHLFAAGVQFIRVHDVGANVDVLKTLCRIQNRQYSRDRR